ncbi:unnamed protein product [Amoebophrya sp. A25]|nr:unnamed protein product [Amoebophrya sp. A25]|eukprot:GSA25T00027249001.1
MLSVQIHRRKQISVRTSVIFQRSIFRFCQHQRRLKRRNVELHF